MARALVIINPAAARTRAASVAAVAAAIRSGGWDAEVLATGGPGDARVLAEYGVQQGVDVVAVFGGDGTTMQAAAALVGTDVILGVIPGGTGNLLAGNLRIPAAPARAADVIVRGKPKRFDLGHMERPGGSQYFAVACGAGYDARVMAGTASAMKHKWKFAAYVATTFRLLDELRISRHYITVDGVEYEAEAAMVLVANCGEVIPPFVRLRSGITPDDGMLDVIVLKASNVRESVRAIWHLLTERAEGEFIRYARGQEVRVVTEPVEPVQLDGEPGGVTPFTATIVPGAIRVMVPG
jgi:YegS/Rv2252/BmrU family lipid kinase